ncbi:hypothetical protein HK099_001596, partial [Clydaea vesicula]
ISEISTRFEQISPRRVAYDNFTTIDWNYDFAKDRIRKRTLKRRIGIKARLAEYYDHFQGWILVLLVGIITGFVAGFIGITAEWLSDVKDGFCLDYFYLSKGFCCLDTEFNQECAGWKNWFEVDSVNNIYGSVLNFLGGYFVFIWFSILFACLSALLVKFYAPYAAGSGIPEVKTILGGFIIRRFLGFWTLLIKTVGLCLSVASGMSLGKEGPLVHVACCVGNIIPKFFKKYANNEAKRREILSCASAAGVSVAFGAPIGGVLFSLEEVSYYFPYKTMFKSYFCAMIAAISLSLMNPFRTGKLVLFQVVFDRDWHEFEFPFFILLGIFGGVYGAFFIKMVSALANNVKLAKIRQTSWIKEWAIMEVIIIALFTAVVSFPFNFLRVNSTELITNLFRECKEIEGDFFGLCKFSNSFIIIFMLLFTCVVKVLLTIFTFGLKIPAGIFIPSMTVGACFGRALGIIMQAWQE